MYFWLINMPHSVKYINYIISLNSYLLLQNLWIVYLVARCRCKLFFTGASHYLFLKENISTVWFLNSFHYFWKCHLKYYFFILNFDNDVVLCLKGPLIVFKLIQTFLILKIKNQNQLISTDRLSLLSWLGSSFQK